MNFSQKSKTLLLLTVMTAMLLAAGCANAPESKPQTNNPVPSDNMTTPTPTPAPEANNNQSADEQANDTNNDLSAQAEKIAQAIVDGVDEVEDANVIISEHMAYAAIKIKATADTAESENIKKAVIEKAKAADSSLTDVYVSESPDTFTRIGEIGRDIADGKPLSGFAEELENMFVRIVPSK